jgi:hypothetical protein
VKASVTGSRKMASRSHARSVKGRARFAIAAVHRRVIKSVANGAAVVGVTTELSGIKGPYVVERLVRTPLKV